MSPYNSPLTLQYIYAPHTAPESVQKEAGCIIGKDYPLPILDEHASKDFCIAKLKNAYALNLHGDAPEVLDGSAKEILRKKHIESGLQELEEEDGKGAKTVKEALQKKGRKKRERDGDGNLDGWVGKKGKKELVQGEQ